MANPVTRSIRKLFSAAARVVATKYLQKDRSYHYEGLRLKVMKDVFHPGLFRSTTVFAGWLAHQNVAGKQVLEIGSGSGLISMIAARNGGIVTAADVNPKAITNTSLNAERNGLFITAYHSDLFDNVPAASFDMILINPPYYPKQPSSDYEKAWYCGANFEYFEKLFAQLSERNDADAACMILSDSCDLDIIHHIAEKNGIALKEIKSKSIAGERLIIYRTAVIV